MQGGFPSRTGAVEAAAEQTGHSDIFVDREQDVCQQSDFGAPKSTPGADKTISASHPPRPRHHELRSGITALMLACADEQQPLESIRELIQSGECVWQKEKAYGRTCLHFAAAHNRWQVVELLVSASRQQARVGSNNSKGGMSGGLWSWMCGCCSGGSSGNGSGGPAGTKCRSLVDEPTKHGFTPLMYAAWCNHAEMVIMLMKSGADLRTRCWAKQDLDDLYCKRCPEGSSALHVATLNGSKNAVQALLSEHMLLQSRDTQQETSKECKVDPRLLKDCDGRTPYDLCTRRRYMAPIEILRGEATNTYMALIPVLNPALPLIRALDLYPPTERIVGAPSLKQIAAKAAQQALLHQIRVVVRSSSELSSSSQGGLRGSGAFEQNKSGSSSCNLPKEGGHAEKRSFPEDVPSGLHALQLTEAAGQSFEDKHGKASENECPERILPNTPEPVRESKVKGADVYSRMLQQPLLEPSSLSRQYNHEWSATPTTEGKCYEPPLSVLSVEPGLSQVKFICRPHHHHHHCLQLTTCITCMEEKPCLPVEPCHHSLCGDCWEQVVSSSDYEAPTCPLCRHIIEGFKVHAVNQEQSDNDE